MNTITPSFCTFLFLFVVNVTLADEWGLEEQTLKHEKSDSIILHYMERRGTVSIMDMACGLIVFTGLIGMISLPSVNLVLYSILMVSHGQHKKPM